MADEKITETEKALRKWKGAKAALLTADYAIPATTASVITAINWDEWFASAGPSLPIGFIALVGGVIMAIMGISKKNGILDGKVSGVYYISLVFACFAISFMLLANIMSQMGGLFLAMAIALLGSGTADQVEKSVIEPNIQEYEELVKANGLSKASERSLKRAELAKREAKAKYDGTAI